MAEKYRLGNTIDPITCHAWNQDRTQIAFSPNNNDVHIYDFRDKLADSKPLGILSGHDLRVMGIDWAPKTNRIVTCGVDRNAYVWTQNEEKKWKPTLVHLRINRAAMCVKWSPLENKLAVGCSPRVLSVSYFEAENDWWVSKHIKKGIRSTVTTVDWHPSNLLLVAGSTDYKIRIFSAFIKDIDASNVDSPWGQASAFGQLLLEIPNTKLGGGWIHSASFSGDGNKICWVGHNSSINVVDANNNFSVTRLCTEYLPFKCCVWITNNSILVAGHSCVPLVYTYSKSGQLALVGKIDNSQKKEAGGLSAMKKFQSLDRNARIETNDTNLESIHQNAITCLCLYKGTKLDASKVSTSGLDGQLVVWDLRSIEKSMQGLKIV